MMIVKRNAGYTLLEIMVVVTIVAIVASIAIPNYTGYLRKARRSDAMATLSEFANAMERYKLTNGNYIGADAGAVPGPPVAAVFGSFAPLDGTAYYTLTIEALTTTTYTLRATPVAVLSQATDGIIELDSTGAERWDEDNSGVPPWDANENDWNPD